MINARVGANVPTAPRPTERYRTGVNAPVTYIYELICLKQVTLVSGSYRGAMALSDYAGRSPRGNEDATVVRVAPHRLWQPGRTRTEQCTNCGDEMVLSEEHFLVVLDEGGERMRRYFREESCIRAWLDAE